MSDSSDDVRWWLYIVETARGALYTGITTDVARRFGEHCAGSPRGAKALRGKGPLQLRLTFMVGDQREALRLERTLKRWPAARKRALINTPHEHHKIILSENIRK